MKEAKMCDRKLHAFERRILCDALDDGPNSLNRFGTWELFRDIALEHKLYTLDGDRKKINEGLLLLRYLSSHAVLREAKRLREEARTDFAAKGVTLADEALRAQHDKRRSQLQYAMINGGFDGLLSAILRHLSHMQPEARIAIIDRLDEKNLLGDKSVLARHAKEIRTAFESREIPPTKVRARIRTLAFFMGGEDICRAMEPEDADGNIREEISA